MTQLRVAYSTGSWQHILDKVTDAIATAKCGARLFDPRYSDLAGAPCPECERVAVAEVAAS